MVRAQWRGLKTNMAKTTGWAQCGARLVDHAPFGHWQTQTFIAALRHDRLDAPWVIGGAMNREFFDLYVETQLAPTLQKGDVVRRGLGPMAAHASPGQPRHPPQPEGGRNPQRNRSMVPVPAALAIVARTNGATRLAPPTSTQSRWHLPNSKPFVGKTIHWIVF